MIEEYFEMEERDPKKIVFADDEDLPVIRVWQVKWLFNDDNVWRAIRLFIDWKNEFGLPFAGAWQDQPWIINTVFRLLNSEYNKHREVEREHGRKRHGSSRHLSKHVSSFG